MMRHMTKFLAAAIAIALSHAPTAPRAMVVDGAVTGGTAHAKGGAFTVLDPATAFRVDKDTHQRFDLYAFDEDQNIIAPALFPVDIGTAPAPGDIVASHYVFFDPRRGSQVGFVDFDADIYGVATSTETMAASDFLANSGVTYLSPNNRGLEAGDDRVWIDPADPRRLWVEWSASSPGDYMRVFTHASPGASQPPIGPCPSIAWPDPEACPDQDRTHHTFFGE